MNKNVVQIMMAALIFARTHDTESAFSLAKKFVYDAEKRFPSVFDDEKGPVSG